MGTKELRFTLVAAAVISILIALYMWLDAFPYDTRFQICKSTLGHVCIGEVYYFREKNASWIIRALDIN